MHITLDEQTILADAARAVGLSPRQVHELRKRGQIWSTKRGSTFYVSIPELERHKKESEFHEIVPMTKTRPVPATAELVDLRKELVKERGHVAEKQGKIMKMISHLGEEHDFLILKIDEIDDAINNLDTISKLVEDIK